MPFSIVTRNSVYELRPTEKLVRIVPGETDRQPTPRFQPAGEWKTYEGIQFVFQGELVMVVTWAYDENMRRNTITSAIQDIVIPESPQ